MTALLLALGIAAVSAWVISASRRTGADGRRSAWPIVAALVTAVLVLMWWGGSFDEPLSHIGLNKNPCIKNAFGATFCGDEAKDYCRSVRAFHPPACATILP